tara:strand:- start:713 stop:1162 length:450 start_codon:yes stop_codon:yes gene_type:complete
MPIKSFRGKITPGFTDTIVLHTNNGSTGYRITKFQVLESVPGTIDSQTVCKIFSISQTTATATIDFSDNTLLAAAYQKTGNSGGDPANVIVVFDNMTFNQDIYVTMADAVGNTADVNYYIELEQVKLDLGQNTVATLKDIRNITESQPT